MPVSYRFAQLSIVLQIAMCIAQATTATAQVGSPNPSPTNSPTNNPPGPESAASAKPSNYCVGRDKSAKQPICMVTGAFTIPFRAELSGKKDVLGGVSADIFVGMSFPKVTWAPTLLVYAGYLPTFSSTNSNGSSSTNGTGAVDFGAGLAFPFSLGINPDINQTPHFGVVVGFDQTSAANKFAYNGKPYISAFVGLSF